MKNGQYWTRGDFLKHYLYGAAWPSSDQGRERHASVQVDSNWYMTEGAGSRIGLENFSAIGKIFESYGLPSGDYTLQQLIGNQYTGIIQSDTIGYVRNYSSIFADRTSAYVFGSAPFRLKDASIRVLNDGTKVLLSANIIPLTDNFDFDFQTSDDTSIKAAKALFEFVQDPFGEGRQFLIEFDGGGSKVFGPTTRTEYDRELISLRSSEAQTLFGLGQPFSPAECFFAGTPILMADGTEKPIETVTAGDWVMAFDASIARGRGPLVPQCVVRTFTNVTDEVVNLGGI